MLRTDIDVVYGMTGMSTDTACANQYVDTLRGADIFVGDYALDGACIAVALDWRRGRPATSGTS
jgi:hypothetical protein